MISVIVPVYNVESYLDQCVQSILGQTYKDFELILVDDGSTDHSGKMCDQYKEKDSRIRVVHKKNGGLSDARNKGTNIAIGSYVTFIDSDDYVSKDYLENLILLTEKYSADIAVTSLERFTDGHNPKITNKKPLINCYTGEKALEKVLYQKGMDTSACALLIRTEIAKENPFPYQKYHEDDYTTYKYYLLSNTVAVSSKKQYFYRQRAGSIMHSFGKASIDELDAADNLVNYCDEYYPHLSKAANSKKFSDYCQVLLSDSRIKNDYPEYFIRIMKYLNKQKYLIIIDSNTRVKNKVAAMCLFLGYRFFNMINRIMIG